MTTGRTHDSDANAEPQTSRTRVDASEQALLSWLHAGHQRRGDRLPPEPELAGMLGVARNTLRRALRRLEDRGDIIRRKGSGTFVARERAPVVQSASGEHLQVRLDQLVPRTSVWAGTGLSFSSGDLMVASRPVGPVVGAALGLPRVVHATTVSRTVLAGGGPVAVTTEVIHPRAPVSRERAFKRALWGGRTTLEALLEANVLVTFSRARVVPLLLSPLDPEAVPLNLSDETPALALEEVIYTGQETCVGHARHVFAPARIDLVITRTLEAVPVAPIVSIVRSAAASPPD